MDRPLPTLDQIWRMALENDWDRFIWKPAYWHEADKIKYAKPRVYWSVFQWSVLTLFWPVTALILAMMPGDGRVFLTVYVLLGSIYVWSDLNKFWVAWEKLHQVRSDQSKLGEIWDRYYEYYGEMLDLSEGNHWRV